MMRNKALVIAAAAALSGTAEATEYRFATEAEAIAILTADDEYMTLVRPLETGIRLKSSTKTSREALKAQYAASVRPWTEEEKAAWMRAVEPHRDALEKYRALVPDTILFIKGSEGIDGGIPHTRGNAIFIGEKSLEGIVNSAEPNAGAGLFAHEYFHVLERAQPDRHDSLFALLGYKPCDFTPPADLDARHLTNPDAPADRHYVPLELEGADGVIPYFYVPEGGYDEAKGGGLGSYFRVSLLAVDVAEGRCAADDGRSGDARLLDPKSVPQFFDAIGRNTDYITHPAETLADNFAYLIVGKEGDLQNPEILTRLSDWLDAAVADEEANR